ncbi:ribonuclease H-like domain-containing protein [Coprothermobacter platensis]|uniref:ribonuclease H-like domain-containing protein n=1 Tax=Coprothermobacter platensis TaxID=108819 RepID=UPI0003747074|nr:ribonuclease H-like domain-containing protein [Coprothermobacter platensis]
MAVFTEIRHEGFAERGYEISDDIWVPKTFLDIETLSLVGSPLTVIGLLRGGPEVRATQLYLLDEEGEKNLLERFLELTDGGDVVTYNGANFDIPFINQRLRYHGLKPFSPELHIDLYLTAKKRFQGKVPSLKQSFLEKHFLGIERVDDVPSRFVPQYYQNFLYDGDTESLEKVLKHNFYDITGLANLYLHIEQSLF